jgi:CRISPR-associated protein Csd1
MLVDALAKYADRALKDQLDDAAWEKKPVPWVLEISRQGTFLGSTPRMTSVARGKKQIQVPQELSFPRSPVNRNSGHHPMLAADDIAYVLGVGPWTPAKAADQEKARKHHVAFVSLLGKAANETGDPGLQACVRFYANDAEVDRARADLKDAKPGALIALSVDGPLVYSEAVQEFWRRHFEAAFTERNAGSVGECLISGKSGPIARTHDKIKGLSSLGGQAAGVALMSFDKEAFRSYGWEQNENSPVSPDRAQAYVLALNDLLRQGKVKPSRRDIAGIGFIFWTRHKDDFNLWTELAPPPDSSVEEEDEPRVEEVEGLLNLGSRYAYDPEPNNFYLAGVSGNGGRLRVRYWVTETLAQVKKNLHEWREQLRVDYPWEDPGPVFIWQLEWVLDRKGEPPAHHTLALLRRAIEGNSQPLGYSMLSSALSRLRHPEEDAKGGDGKRKDPMRLPRLRIPIGLIRLCLNDIQRSKGEPEMKEGLDPDCALPAYVCGRLMAEYENLQRASVRADKKRRGVDMGEAARGPDVNVSTTDRYFALASTYPTVAFPKIEDLARKHLRKLQRDSPKSFGAIERRLLQLHDKLQPTDLGAYPGKLGLEGQGLFALGYYHQKAKQKRDQNEAFERKRLAKEAKNRQEDSAPITIIQQNTHV